jgi:hypothetical protein
VRLLSPRSPRSGARAPSTGNPFVYDRARDSAILIEQGIFEYLEVWEWPAQ